jgi:3-oxoacyl-[acyl-carrier protein] reductase
MSASETLRRVALVTGATGGLGQGIVAAFAAQGWRVAAAGHSKVAPSMSPDVLSCQLDVVRRHEAMRTVEAILAHWGRLDVLVNAAGVAEDALLVRMDETAWDRVLAVNLTGAFLCAQAVLRQMVRQKEGQIINISSFAIRGGSCAGATGGPAISGPEPGGQANYAAAKAGLIGLSQSLAKEVGSRGVRVNIVLPGVLPTPMTARLSRGQLSALSAANALGRLNTIEEVARFVVFLAGTRNISGQVFQLDSRIAPWS